MKPRLVTRNSCRLVHAMPNNAQFVQTRRHVESPCKVPLKERFSQRLRERFPVGHIVSVFLLDMGRHRAGCKWKERLVVFRDSGATSVL